MISSRALGASRSRPGSRSRTQQQQAHALLTTVVSDQGRVREQGPEVSTAAVELAFPEGAQSEQQRQSAAGFATIEAALQDVSAGNFVVVLDNEDRENEGDLIIAADKVPFQDFSFTRLHLQLDSIASAPS